MSTHPLLRPKLRRGETHYMTTLTNEDVRIIRQIAEDREKLAKQLKCITNIALAEKFGVHRRTIERLLAGETWGHI